MVLTTYGKSTGFCIDPIEKKPLNHFLPGTSVLSFGTAGCNLGCKFCQNWDISKSREIERLSETAGPPAIAQAAKRAGCASVAFTYNDPVIWAEYAMDTANACHDLGIKTVAVTAGYIQPKAREAFYAVMDAANVDLKAFTELFYKHLCLARLDPVLDTLRWLKHESDVWFEITNLMIPEENDSADETARMCDWIVTNLGDDVPVHFTAFHPDFRLLHRPHTPHETLVRAWEQARAAGIKFAYVGNVYDAERQSTYCPSCRTLLIERDWYELGVYRLNGNRCAACGAVIPGVYASDRGNWGRRRLPIVIREEPSALTPNLCGGLPIPVTKTDGQTKAQQPSGAAGSATRAPQPVRDESVSARPKIDFSESEVDAILHYVRMVVEKSVKGADCEVVFPPELRQAAAYGVFVTLERASLLRACRGRWGADNSLEELLTGAARDAALNDPRFPSLVPQELPYLHIDVSLMHSPRRVEGKGTDREREVEPGRHGLVIAHPHGRGLLLPQVAARSGWDARAFLENVCRKAGLSPSSWTEDDAELMTFEARVLNAAACVPEFDARQLSARIVESIIDYVNRILQDDSTSANVTVAGLHDRVSHDLGVCLQTVSGQYALVTGTNQSVVELTASAVQSLKQSLAAKHHSKQPVDRLTVLWQPIVLLSADYPARHKLLGRSGIVVRGEQRWGFALPSPHTNRDPIADAFGAARLDLGRWRSGKDQGTRVTAFVQQAHQARAVASNVRESATRVRPAAKAGQFYPADPQEMTRDLNRFVAAAGECDRACYDAVMLPHAGWMYCGSVIGKTLARVNVPELVIVLCPNHTGFGATWSVSPADRWEIPGASIPIDADIRNRLLELAPQLTCEPDAHREEHAVEVLLPFLHRFNPSLRLVPIVVGAHEYEQTVGLARALSSVICERTQRVLLVISSDMNHFAKERENRRLDFLALDAMLTGDSRRLYDVVRANRISMCGVIPAVTVMQAITERNGTLQLALVDYTNSGQVTGELRRVVGYAGVVLKVDTPQSAA
jgi:AmmeMemoRadiSam system radical SAM enzyme/AmmeMemoRadiSam system protein B/AmmeMemoRadiSam system protein A